MVAAYHEGLRRSSGRALQFDRKPRIAAAAASCVHPRRMTTLTKRQRSRLAADDSRWTAVLAHDRGRRRPRSSTPCARPASTAGRRARAGGRGAIASRFFDAPALARERRVPRLQALRARHGRGGGRSVDRQDPPRLRLSVERRGPSVAGHAGGASGRQPVSPAAQLQAPRRRHAAGIRGGVRLRKVKGRLRQAGDITGAMLDAGYGSSSRFYERAVPKLGMAPSAYRRGGAGMSIAYAIVDSAERVARPAAGRGDAARRLRGGDGIVGRGADARAVARVSVGDDRRRRRRARRNGRRRSSRISQDASRGSICRSTCRRRRFSGRCGRRSPRFRTARRAPTRRSPQSIGKPSAARAVARACATNPVALAIPCHRVVPAAGGEGGYRWGRAEEGAAQAGEREGRKAGGAGEAGRQEAEGGHGDDCGGRRDRRIVSAAVDWAASRASLDAQGLRALPAMLDPDECGSSRGLYAQRRRFPQPHRHVALPLRRRRVQVLRRAAAADRSVAARGALCTALAPIANRWSSASSEI